MVVNGVGICFERRPVEEPVQHWSIPPLRKIFDPFGLDVEVLGVAEPAPTKKEPDRTKDIMHYFIGRKNDVLVVRAPFEYGNAADYFTYFAKFKNPQLVGIIDGESIDSLSSGEHCLASQTNQELQRRMRALTPEEKTVLQPFIVAAFEVAGCKLWGYLPCG